MSDQPEEMLTGTIDDYLLAMADGIVKAQNELNRISVQSAQGQAPVQYQLPKLDFELKMSFSLEKETESDQPASTSSSSRRLVSPFNRKLPLLRAMPVNPDTTSEHFTAEGVSTIKGSFIALPLNGGKPPNILGLTLMEHSKQKALLQISLRNAVGEALAGQTVALGIDRDYSRTLNEERGLTGAKQTLKPSTDFVESEIRTGEDGTAIATLNIASQEAPEVSIVIEASAGPLSESLIIHQSS